MKIIKTTVKKTKVVLGEHILCNRHWDEIADHSYMQSDTQYAVSVRESTDINDECEDCIQEIKDNRK